MRWIPVTLFLCFLGCGDDFATVQNTDTIEAYEFYLEAHPNGTYSFQASGRLEDLYLIKAREDQSLEGYDAYFKRFPEGNLKSRAYAEREGLLFGQAREVNTLDAWEAYLKEYPHATKKKKKEAQRMIKVHGYADNLELSEPEITQINLAEDPEGPLNGWGFQVRVTNTGDKTLATLHLTMVYLDDEGHALDFRDWPVVAPYWNTPIEEERKVPMKPGDTRPWDWSSGDMPDGWSKRVRVYPSRVTFADPDSAK
jgi:hypothetical protein